MLNINFRMKTIDSIYPVFSNFFPLQTSSVIAVTESLIRCSIYWSDRNCYHYRLQYSKFIAFLFQVGLISDEKLVDLLDLALSADTVNTVKRLREIMEAGVEPLALMSQVATVITDILAGSYVFTRERLRRRFFQRQTCKSRNLLVQLCLLIHRCYFSMEESFWPLLNF